MQGRQKTPIRQFGSHPRRWRDNLYVYPVISRRSRGLSIGINLNPDTACNFDCVYCQVDRAAPPRTRRVELGRLRAELADIIADTQSGSLFEDAPFADVPPGMRHIRDFAFSGDGEPTTCPSFHTCVEWVAELRRKAGLDQTKIVLITDACYLTKPEVVSALAVLDKNNGEIWAKLDAGTENYFQEINRPNFPLTHVVDNIISAARVRPIVIQSLFMKLRGQRPSESELSAYVQRLHDITQAGGAIDHVQVYTVARRPAEAYVSALSNAEIDAIARLVREEANLPAEPYYAST